MHVSASKFQQMQRQNPTDAEAVMWFELRNRQLGGYKFTRQMTIGIYTVDFVCRSKRLILELDGGQHCENTFDAKRTEWLNRQGYDVLRFWNNEVLEEREAVLETLLLVLEGTITDNSTGLNFSCAQPPERVR